MGRMSDLLEPDNTDRPPGGPRRIVYLTAGAAGMYCGSCLRDNALARALLRAGLDVQLVPTYTPLTTDLESVAGDRVFLGGINMFLQQKSRLFRWLPRSLDRWLSHPRFLRRMTSGPRRTDPRLLGALTVSVLQGTAGRQAKEFHELIEWLEAQQPEIIDLSNLLIAGCLPELRRRLRASLVVTLQGDDLFVEKLPPPYRSQALNRLRELAQVPDAIIVYSDFYRRRVVELFGVPDRRVHVVPLGIETEAMSGVVAAPARNAARVPVVGYLARLCEEKGFDRFIDVLLELRRRPGWGAVRAEALGSWGDEGLGYIERQKLRFASASGDPDALTIRVNASHEEKLAFLQRIDCLCVPTRYEEPKGMFALEALAAGVPVVLPAHGTFPELIDQLGGGLLVPPGDTVATADAVESLLEDADRRADLAQSGHRSVRQRRSADVMARRTLSVYDSVTLGGRDARADARAPGRTQGDSSP